MQPYTDEEPTVTSVSVDEHVSHPVISLISFQFLIQRVPPHLLIP